MLGIAHERGLLVLDDAHLIDEATTQFLTFLAHRLLGRRRSIVAAWRTEDVPPTHPLATLLARGRRVGWALAIELGRLDREGVATLVGDAKADAVLRVTEGLPMLVAAYAASTQPDPEVLLDSVESLAASRLGRLSPIAQQVIEAVAVIDRAADRELLCEVAGRTVDETAEALVQLEAAALVTTGPDGRSSLTHHLIGGVVTRRMSPARQRVLRDRAIDVLSVARRREAEAARQCEQIGMGDGPRSTTWPPPDAPKASSPTLKRFRTSSGARAWPSRSRRDPRADRGSPDLGGPLRRGQASYATAASVAVGHA